MGDDALDGGDGADAFMVDPMSGNDVVVAGFTPGAGAFDHVAFIDSCRTRSRSPNQRRILGEHEIGLRKVLLEHAFKQG